MIQSPEEYRKALKKMNIPALLREEDAEREKLDRLYHASKGTDAVVPSVTVQRKTARAYLREIADEFLERAAEKEKAVLCTEHYDIVCNKGDILAMSDYFIPLEIGHSAQSAEKWRFRSRLQAALRHLVLREGTVLLGQYYEENTHHGIFDLENMLFYNIGSTAFKPLVETGIAFSVLDPATPLSGNRKCCYVYQLALVQEVTAQFSSYTPAVEWKGVALDFSIPQSPLRYWQALRSQQDKIKRFVLEHTVDGGFAVFIELHLRRKVSLAATIKPLLDGVICAFHGEYGFDPAAYFRQMIYPPFEHAVLEPREYYRSNRGWNPADERCRLALVTVSYDAESPYFNGKLMYLPTK